MCVFHACDLRQTKLNIVWNFVLKMVRLLLGKELFCACREGHDQIGALPAVGPQTERLRGAQHSTHVVIQAAINRE